MKPLRWLFSLALLAGSAAAQTLDCPGSANTARPCEAFHYHIQLYRPDTRGFLDVWGVNQFASQSACADAREVQMKRNLAVVQYFRTVRNEQQYEADRLGQCHCDMTWDKSNPRYLTDVQRTTQIKAMEEVRQRVRERLMDAGITTDSELVRGLTAPPLASTSLLGGPKMTSLPAATAVAQASNSANDLKPTKAIDTSKPAAASFDLPLVDMPVSSVQTAEPASAAAGAPAGTTMTVTVPVQTASVQPTPAEASAAATPATTPTTPATTPATTGASPATAPVPPSSATRVPAPSPVSVSPPPPAATTESMPTAATEEAVSAEEAADAFISVELSRMSNVLAASSAITDETVKSKIYEAVNERNQLLSNLRALIQGSGMRSRLAVEVRATKSEPERVAFAARLFGDEIARHWAPKDASDVILTSADADSEAERVLRDTAGHYSEQQRKRALYLLLARTQPTEEQQLWLSTVVESFLR